MKNVNTEQAEQKLDPISYVKFDPNTEETALEMMIYGHKLQYYDTIKRKLRACPVFLDDQNTQFIIFSEARKNRTMTRIDLLQIKRMADNPTNVIQPRKASDLPHPSCVLSVVTKNEDEYVLVFATTDQKKLFMQGLQKLMQVARRKLLVIPVLLMLVRQPCFSQLVRSCR